MKTLTALVAVCGLVFGIVKFIQVQQIEASKPYLEKKLEWCEEAVEMASAIANAPADPPANAATSAPDKAQAAEQRFWELYWGVMGLVENQDVLNAMVEFGRELDTRANLKGKSLALAHACRSEMAKDWSSSWAR